MLDKLVDTIVNYSLEVKSDDKVLITSYLEAKEFILKLVDKIISVGGIPVVKLKDSEIDSLIMEKSLSNRVNLVKTLSMEEAINYDCFINIRCMNNDYESKDTNKKLLKEIGDATLESDDIRINTKRWVLLNYPTALDAYKNKTSYRKYYDYALKAMTFDYAKMLKDMEPLKKLMEQTDKVHIVDKNTDLTFSIKDIPVIPCAGKSNIPDGEIYTAPIKDSVEGYITYNTPCPYQGNVYTGVRLEFSNGKIVNCTCNEDVLSLKEIFDTDLGARYIGEFSIGLNPMIRTPMGDILYDEKIIGSIHFTPGRAYKDAFNGNISSIHWDMVLLNPDIYFDDVLIRKNGKFVIDSLKHLNYE